MPNCEDCPINPVQFGELLATVKGMAADMSDLKTKVENHIENDRDTLSIKNLLSRDNIVPALLLLAISSGSGAGVFKVLEKFL